MTKNFSLYMEQSKEQVEFRLAQFFTGKGLEEAMRYSLLAGGKRIRPILTMAFCAAAGGREEEALEFGCGVEMLHTYSLIHDDLPCMDNDDLRRGKPTCHKQFNECIATLAGDALQAAAFQTILNTPGPWENDPTAPGMAAGVLAQSVGVEGMCGGQYWDTEDEEKPHTLEELYNIHDKKTGALLRASCMLGVLASTGHRPVDKACLNAAKDYATHVGMAFQIRDDILDAVSTTEELGKPVGSDAANGKTTYVSLLGLEKCEKLVLEYTAQAKAALNQAKWLGDTKFLCWLADQMAERSC